MQSFGKTVSNLLEARVTALEIGDLVNRADFRQYHAHQRSVQTFDLNKWQHDDLLKPVAIHALRNRT